MAKFNTSAAKKIAPRVAAIATAVPDTHNLAGGQAYQQSPKFQLLFTLLTSFMENQFYRSRNDTMQKLDAMITQVNDNLFVAKAATFARNQYGMRSVSHYVASRIAKIEKGSQWTKHFYKTVVRRPDDATEILAAYIAFYGRKAIPNSLKKGLGLGLGKFDSYQIAKYRGEGNGLSMVDLVNLTHPKPTMKNSEALSALVAGTLRSADTWEVELSEAGQGVDSEVEKAANKKEVWKDLVQNRKIGYFALLRNLRNILTQADAATIEEASAMLVDANLIKKSLVLPFRFSTAYKELENSSVEGARKMCAAVNKAAELALANVPIFEGKSLIAMDRSSSMMGIGGLSPNGKPKATPVDIGSSFTAVLAKTNDADVLLFAGDAAYTSYSLSDSLMSIAKNIRSQCNGGSTNFRAIFNVANKKYDRIIILSDMQAWVGYNSPAEAYRNYCNKYKADPAIFCFDLQGYGTTQFPEKHVYSLAGFSDKTMDLMKVLETNPQALLAQVDAISFE